MIVYKELGAELRIQFYPCCVHTGDEDFTLLFYTGEYKDSEEFFNTKCVIRRKDELKDIKGNMATVYLEESELNKMGDGVLKIACNYGDAIKHTSQNYYIKSPEYDYSIKYIYTQDDMNAAQEGFKNSLQEKNVKIHFNELGGTITPDSGYSGLSKVTYDANEVRQFWYDGGVATQKMKLSGATFTESGDYTRDDGWSAVSVNIPIQSRKDVTDLGTLKDVDEGRSIYPDQGYRAIGAVYARVDPDASGVVNLRKMAFNSGKTAQEKEDAAKLTTTAITENGIYTAPYGYSQVTVNVATASADTARREGWEEGRTYLDIREIATNTTKYEFTLCQGGTMQLNSNKWTTFTVDGMSFKSDQTTVSAQNSDKKIVLEGVESIASASNISINAAVKDITITCNNSNIWNIDLDNSTSGNITVNGNVNIVRDGGLGSPCNAQLKNEYIILFNGNVRKMEDRPIAYGIDDGIDWTYYFNANFTYPPILSEAFFTTPNGYGYKYKITSKYGGEDWETGDDWRYAFDYYNFGTTHHWTFNSID